MEKGSNTKDAAQLHETGPATSAAGLVPVNPPTRDKFCPHTAKTSNSSYWEDILSLSAPGAGGVFLGVFLGVFPRGSPTIKWT
eukprot:4930211-Pyramimonas_sp.AAC.1